MKIVCVYILYFLNYIYCQADVCEKYPCANGGMTGMCQAYGDGTGRYCSCQLGFQGSDCSIDACRKQPCSNGGTCFRAPNGRDCICPLGFSGDDCSIEECSAHPCRNGATCIPIFKGRQCICPLGYNGDDCSTDLCANRCENDGQCIRTSGKSECVCHPGYTGEKCESGICDPNPCFNGRECHKEDVEFHCHCHQEGGRRCEYDDIFLYGRPLLPYSYILPNITKGFIYIPWDPIHGSGAYIYGMRVVTTGNPTPFNIQIWRDKQDNNVTLVYNKRITLPAKATVHEIKFIDIGIKCGRIKDWDRVGLYFPEGSDGIGLHKCSSNCGVLLHKNPPEDLEIGNLLTFEWKDSFDYHFGIKLYFALEGEYGRKLDSKGCPENVDLPEPTFGDKEDLVETKDYTFSFMNSFKSNDDECSMQNMKHVEEMKSSLIIIGAVLGGLLLISFIVIICSVIKMCLQQTTGKPNAPPGGNVSKQATKQDGYLVPQTNQSFRSDNDSMSYLEIKSNHDYKSLYTDPN